jgi:S-adenosylmethionine:tRNA-ribosyltransferase-isomerase (queuine synthetase)
MYTIRESLRHYLKRPDLFELWLRSRDKKYWRSLEDSESENAVAEWLYDCIRPDEDSKIAYVLWVEVNNDKVSVVVDEKCHITVPTPQWVKDFRAALKRMLYDTVYANQSECLEAFANVSTKGV